MTRHDFGAWLTVFQSGDRTAVVLKTGDQDDCLPWFWCMIGGDYQWEEERTEAESAARRALMEMETPEQ